MEQELFELSFPQKSMYQLEQVTNSKNLNTIFSIMTFTSKLEIEYLDLSLNKIFEINDAFRLTFVKDQNNFPKQYIKKYEYSPITVIYHPSDDITELAEEYNSTTDISIYGKTFDFTIVSCPNSTYVFFKAHHIISDAWGLTKVADQIKEFYTKFKNKEDLNNISKTSYLGLIEREKKYLSSSKYEIDKNFWDEYTNNMVTSNLFSHLDLFDKKAARYEVIIDNNLSQRVEDFCKTQKISEFSFFMGILSTYYNKFFSSKEIIIGSPFLNRQKRYDELDCAGLYVSTLPIDIKIESSNLFIDLCKKITQDNLKIFKHSNYPYDEIQKLYNKNHNTNGNLYNIGFSYQINKLESKLENNELGPCKWFFAGEQNNPFTFHVSRMNNITYFYYDYLHSCYSEEEIKKMNSIFLNLIFQILDNPEIKIEDVDILTNEDKALLMKFNSTNNINLPKENVIDIFKKVVVNSSKKTALLYNNEKMTYQELDEKSSKLANFLLSFGLSKNKPIVLFFDKSFEMIISILAVLKAGACYVPILPDENQDRIKYIINDCNPFFILTHKDYSSTLAKYNIPSINVENETTYSNFETEVNLNNITPENIAYIIYTSGSTGNPKGTEVMHKNIVSLHYSMQDDEILKCDENDVSMSLLKYSFDASGIDIYSSILSGSKLLLVSKDDELNPEKVVKLIENQHVTRSFLIPKWLEHIAISDDSLNANLSYLKILGTGGEALKPITIEKLLLKYPKLKILNLYGPTETTMFTTYKEVSIDNAKTNQVSIGKPILYSRALVVNEQNDIMPINTKGELIIYEDENSIKNIAKGYLNLDELTNKKFITIKNTLINKKVRAYKTGDLVKITPDLEIEFFGRTDDVVKINGGYLVALNEIGSRISSILGPQFEICPIAVPYKNTKVIVLFIKNNEKNISIYNITKEINNNISFYMRPKKIIELEEFPRNNSGKIDKKKLFAIAEQEILCYKNELVLPKTQIEKEIYSVVKNVSGYDEFSIIDDFLDDLGIDSLSLTTINTSLDKYSLTMQDLYNNPSVKKLAAYISNKESPCLLPNLANIDDITILNNAKDFDLSTVLLTGVTGFLGIHLLNNLLLDSNVSTIYCIIRNKFNLAGKQRLTNMIDYYFNSSQKLLELIDEKVIILNGDISNEHFGLDIKTYEEIQQNVTTVINSAANVKHFAKLEVLRQDNVKSVENIIEFCSDKISLAHISTLSIAGFKNENTLDITFDENTLFINQDFKNQPYLISKFEAEKVVLEAIEHKNLNAKIFRLGNISPRISDGLFQSNYSQNVFMKSLHMLVNEKIISEKLLDIKIEFSPVDECAYNIFTLIKASTNNNIYHILNNKDISVGLLIEILKDNGYILNIIDHEKFSEIVNAFNDEYIKEYISNTDLNDFSQNNTLKILKSKNITWSDSDSSYIKKILAVLEQNEW